MIKGFIFDLDGVIVFTDRFHYLAWKAIADEERIYFDERINNRLRGVSRMDSLDIILERAERSYSAEEKLALAEKKNALYQNYLRSMSEKDVSEDVLSMLKELRRRNISIAIGSSSRNTKLILRQVGIDGLFDAVSDGTMITHSKPDPEVFLKARDLLGIPADELGVVEDAKAGIDAALAGGFTAFGIGDAADYTRTSHPIHKVSDLLNFI